MDPLYESVKEEIFGEIIAQHKPPPKKRVSSGPSLSAMKKSELIEECKKLGLDESGKVSDLRERLKAAREVKEESVEDLFKNYEQGISKDESLREDHEAS